MALICVAMPGCGQKCVPTRDIAARKNVAPTGKCFANTVRRSAQKAHIVVVNHSLLFSDIVSENAVLGEYERPHPGRSPQHRKNCRTVFGTRTQYLAHQKILPINCKARAFTAPAPLPALRHWMGVADLKDNTFATFDKGIGRAVNAAERHLSQSADLFSRPHGIFVRQTGQSQI